MVRATVGACLLGSLLNMCVKPVQCVQRKLLHVASFGPWHTHVVYTTCGHVQ
jgi:hypothetical protein